MSNQTLPTLFKKTSTGAIQYWTIGTDSNQIITDYGQLDTENPQRTVDIIAEGKNTGRSNATTPEEQAVLEAKAKWTKQLKKGYVDDIEAARAGERNAIIAGGIDPMLAHKYSVNGVLTKDAKKIIFPCFGQPKLDGIRCIAIKKDGVVTLWTRTRKPILSIPHIIAALSKIPGDWVLDGELYNHEYRQDFDTIIELVRPDEPVEGHEKVQYHVYDVFMDAPFKARTKWLEESIGEWLSQDPLHRVTTHVIEAAEGVNAFKELMLEYGYEGSMVRNADGMYKVGRSYDLQKCKDMLDAEYKIVDFEEGRGRLMGHVGSFWCVTADGKRFKAKQKGKITRLKEYFDDHSLWADKLLTVQYQNLTPDGIPRFPVGKSIRNYE